MRYCHYCEEPMYTSNNSVWYKKLNYQVHKKCERDFQIWISNKKEKKA